jgi:hypothetical protein
MNEMGYHFFLEPGTGEPRIWRHHVTEREAIEAIEAVEAVEHQIATNKSP